MVILIVVAAVLLLLFVMDRQINCFEIAWAYGLGNEFFLVL